MSAGICSSPARPASSAPTSCGTGVDRHPDDASSPSTPSPTPACGRTSTASTAVTFVHADIGDTDTVADTLRTSRRRRGRQLRRRVAQQPGGRSIPARFFRTNVLGTQGLCEAARRVGVRRLHHVSTCEVYGDLDLDTDEAFTEDSPYRPRTPYNASKAGGDHVVRAYHETWDLPITITNCANNYGPVPVPGEGDPATSRRSRCGDEPLPMYASTQNRREWIHAVDHCRAIDAILERGRVGETYHVGTGVERSIEEIADTVLGHARQAGVAEDDRARPARPRPALRARLVEDPHRAGLGARDRVGRRDRRDDRLVRRPPRVVGTAARPRAGRRVDRLGVARAEPADVRVLVTGAGGQLGRDVVRCGRRPRATTSSAPTTPRSTSPTATRCSERSRTCATGRRRPLRRVDGGRRLRGRPGPGVHGERAGDPLGRRGLPPGRTPTSCTCPPTTCSTARLERPYARVGRAQPAVGVRRVEAGRRAGGARRSVRLPPSCARRGCAASTGRTSSRRSCARVRARASRWRSSTTSAGAPPSPPTWPAMLRRLAVDRRPGVYHVTNQGAVTWYEFVREVVAAGRARPSDGSGRSRRPSSTRHGRRRGRPTACWTTPPSAPPASRCSATSESRSPN